MEEKRIPSLLLNILFAQIEETTGRRSLFRLLRQAELSDFAAHPPSLDESPTIPVADYSRLLGLVYDVFGAPSARAVFTNLGRLSAPELRRQRPGQFAIAGTALKLLPAGRRIQFVLSRLSELGEALYGTPHQTYDEGAAFFFEMADCPYCAAITRLSDIQGKPVGSPVCHTPLAMIEEMVTWITGQKHLVEEVACIAQGAPACRFRVAK